MASIYLAVQVIHLESLGNLCELSQEGLETVLKHEGAVGGKAPNQASAVHGSQLPNVVHSTSPNLGKPAPREGPGTSTLITAGTPTTATPPPSKPPYPPLPCNQHATRDRDTLLLGRANTLHSSTLQSSTHAQGPKHTHIEEGGRGGGGQLINPASGCKRRHSLRTCLPSQA